MKILDVLQGSSSWAKERARCFCASEASQMMGASKYQSRDDLLKLKATGIAPEVNATTQKIFDKGHATEAAIRPLFDEILGEELYPVTGSLEVEGLPLLASFDGLTIDESIGFEHKLWNEKLAVACRTSELEPHYYWQLEQQLLISGAERIIFATSDGTDKNLVWMDYFPVDGRREQLIAGWQQFKIDLANYVAPEAEAPKAIAEPVETLPAITYSTQFNGKSIELQSNLKDYKAAAMRLVEQSKKQLESDQDFADAEARIKACKTAEERIAVIRENVLGEVADIDMFSKELGAIGEMLRQCRLNEDKQVKARKEAIKAEELSLALGEWNHCVAEINSGLFALGKVRLPTIHADFQGAIKGLKTVASLRSKLNDELARAKIEAEQLRKHIVNNVELIEALAPDHKFLFSDIQQLVERESEYVATIVKGRLADHKQAEQERIQAEAKRIADAQVAKDRAEQEAKEQEAAKFNESQIAKFAEAQAAAVEAVAPLQSTLAAETQAVMIKAAMTAPVVMPEQPEYTEPMVDMSDYQRGIVAGLELAKNILIKNPNASIDDLFLIFSEFIEAKNEQLQAA